MVVVVSPSPSPVAGSPSPSPVVVVVVVLLVPLSLVVVLVSPVSPELVMPVVDEVSAWPSSPQAASKRHKAAGLIQTKREVNIAGPIRPTPAGFCKALFGPAQLISASAVTTPSMTSSFHSPGASPWVVTSVTTTSFLVLV